MVSPEPLKALQELRGRTCSLKGPMELRGNDPAEFKHSGQLPGSPGAGTGRTPGRARPPGPATCRALD